MNSRALIKADAILQKYNHEIKDCFIAYIASQTKIEKERAWENFLKTVQRGGHIVETSDVIELMNLTTDRNNKVKFIADFIDVSKQIKAI